MVGDVSRAGRQGRMMSARKSCEVAREVDGGDGGGAGVYSEKKETFVREAGEETRHSDRRGTWDSENQKTWKT